MITNNNLQNNNNPIPKTPESTRYNNDNVRPSTPILSINQPNTKK